MIITLGWLLDSQTTLSLSWNNIQMERKLELFQESKVITKMERNSLDGAD